MMACMRSGGDHSPVLHPECGCCSAHCQCFRRLGRGDYGLLRALEQESVRPCPYFPVPFYDGVRLAPMGVRFLESKRRRA